MICRICGCVIEECECAERPTPPPANNNIARTACQYVINALEHGVRPTAEGCRRALE